MLDFSSLSELELVHRLGWTLLHSTWLLSLLGLLVAAELRALRRSSANARYAVAMLGLLGAAVLPCVIYFSIDVSAAAQVAVSGSGNDIMNSLSVETEPTVSVASLEKLAHPATISAEAANPASRFNWRLERLFPWVVGLWMLGMILLSARLLLAWVFLRKLKTVAVTPVNAATQALCEQVCDRLGMRPTIRILQSSLVSVPMAFGVLRPCLLLPASAVTGLSTEALEAIVAHELAHVRRNDYLLNLLQCLVEISLFFHPAVWWISKQARIERENCCDDVAAGVAGDPVAYARVLAQVAEMGQNPLALVTAADGGDLLARIRRLLALRTGEELTTPRWMGAAVSLLSVCLLAGMIAFSIAGPQAAGQAMAAEEQGPDDDAADDQQDDRKLAAEYEKLCRLAEAEDIKMIPPPFPESRLAFYRVSNPAQAAAIPRGPDNMYLRMKGGQVVGQGMSFGDGSGAPLETVLQILADVYPQDLVGEQELKQLPFPGDFIINPKSSKPRLLARLEKLYNDQKDRPNISLAYRVIDRDVYVAKGKYEFKPIDAQRESVEIYGKRLNSNPSRGGGGGGKVDRLLEWAGMWIGVPVVNGGVKPPKRNQIRWHFNDESSFSEEERRLAKDPEMVLQHLTEQTGLTFEKQKRKAKVVVLERVPEEKKP